MRQVAAVALLLLVGGCASSGGSEELTVFAASSLELAFEDLAARFEETHPGVDVKLSLAGSQTLATQIVHGAEPDVFAAADHEQMARVVAARKPDIGPVEFAANRLVVVVAAGNPAQIGGLADLARDDLLVVLGAEEVPAGEYARRALKAAGVEANVASYEPNVGLVLAKVALGEADAGIVYESDLRRSESPVEGVPIPARFNVTAHYPIAGWGEGPSREFVDLVLSGTGRAVLRKAGFQA